MEKLYLKNYRKRYPNFKNTQIRNITHYKHNRIRARALKFNANRLEYKKCLRNKIVFSNFLVKNKKGGIALEAIFNVRNMLQYVYTDGKLTLRRRKIRYNHTRAGILCILREIHKYQNFKLKKEPFYRFL